MMHVCPKAGDPCIRRESAVWLFLKSRPGVDGIQPKKCSWSVLEKRSPELHDLKVPWLSEKLNSLPTDKGEVRGKIRAQRHKRHLK